jgi:uncharacterized membrane protein YoaK (UPF0700 family)
MTGNTVLLAIALARGSGPSAIRSAVALAAFSLGAVSGSAVRRAGTAFAFEAVAIAGAAVLATLSAHLPAIATGAGAMGLQTATLRPRNDTGVKVTYLTGTVTAFWGRLMQNEEDAAFPLIVWLTYGIGAVIGALLTGPLGSAALLPAAAVAAVSARSACARAHRPDRMTASSSSGAGATS